MEVSQGGDVGRAVWVEALPGPSGAWEGTWGERQGQAGRGWTSCWRVASWGGPREDSSKEALSGKGKGPPPPLHKWRNQGWEGKDPLKLRWVLQGLPGVWDLF